MGSSILRGMLAFSRDAPSQRSRFFCLPLGVAEVPKGFSHKGQRGSGHSSQLFTQVSGLTETWLLGCPESLKFRSVPHFPGALLQSQSRRVISREWRLPATDCLCVLGMELILEGLILVGWRAALSPPPPPPHLQTLLSARISQACRFLCI